MFTPVSAFTTAEPPRSSMAVTMIFVKKQKARNTMCAAVPHLKKNIIITPVRKKLMDKNSGKAKLVDHQYVLVEIVNTV